MRIRRLLPPDVDFLRFRGSDPDCLSHLCMCTQSSGPLPGELTFAAR